MFCCEKILKTHELPLSFLLRPFSPHLFLFTSCLLLERGKATARVPLIFIRTRFLIKFSILIKNKILIDMETKSNNILIIKVSSSLI